MLETAKHNIPQATNIPHQPLLIKPIFSVLGHAEKQFFSKLVFLYLVTLFDLVYKFVDFKSKFVPFPTCRKMNILKLGLYKSKDLVVSQISV